MFLKGVATLRFLVWSVEGASMCKLPKTSGNSG